MRVYRSARRDTSVPRNKFKRLIIAQAGRKEGNSGAASRRICIPPRPFGRQASESRITCVCWWVIPSWRSSTGRIPAQRSRGGHAGMQGPALPGGNCLLMALCGVTMLCVSSAVDRASAAFCVAPLRSPSTSAAGAASLAKHLRCPPGRQGSPLRSAFRVGRVPASGEWCGGLRTRERRALRSGSSDTMPNRPEPVSPLWGDWTDIEVKAATVIWVNRMVIGLDLCPFALGSMPGL